MISGEINDLKYHVAHLDEGVEQNKCLKCAVPLENDEIKFTSSCVSCQTKYHVTVFHGQVQPLAVSSGIWLRDLSRIKLTLSECINFSLFPFCHLCFFQDPVWAGSGG